MNEYVAVYKEQLAIGDIQIAYEFLLKYLSSTKASFEKNYGDKYSYGNIGRGFLDITYYPFSTSYLKEKNLRYGIVLNHEKIQFELWLMGKNINIQKNYWQLLKSSEWNQHQPTMPKYSIIEVALVENPDFDHLDDLTQMIIDRADKIATEITAAIKEMDEQD